MWHAVKTGWHGALGLGAALSVVGVGLWNCAAPAQGNAPLSYFQSLPASHLQTLHGKLSYLSLSWHGSPRSVIFAGPNATPSVSPFVPFYDPRVAYDHDSAPPPDQFTASVTELDGMLDSIATVAAVVDTTPDATNLLEFALIDTAGGSPMVFESRVSADNARLLLGRMRGALQNNGDAVALLNGTACELGVLSAATPTERTSQIAFDYGGVRRNWAKGEFVGKIKVTNTSNPAISAPVYLVLVLSAPNVSLVNASGYACQPLRTGSPPVQMGTPYILLPVIGSLARNASVEVQVHFKCSEFDPPNMTGRVFAGPGDM